MSKRYQVVGIGNSIVDILSHIEDSFLAENGVERGIMQLIDKPRAVELYSKMGPAKEISGGSAANTIAGIAHLGGKTAYVGKVKDDQLGDIFAHDMKAQGADYDTPRATGDDHETGRGPDSHEAFAKAIKACKGAGGKVSLTLSDPFCVERHRDAFREMIKNDIDLLFANEHEIEAMYQTGDLDTSMAAAAKECEIVACTVGSKGAYVLSGGEKVHAPATAVKIVDATGAGDLFAAGFLFGITQGQDMLTSGKAYPAFLARRDRPKIKNPNAMSTICRT